MCLYSQIDSSRVDPIDVTNPWVAGEHLLNFGARLRLFASVNNNVNVSPATKLLQIVLLDYSYYAAAIV